jgi:hypothetical protein
MAIPDTAGQEPANALPTGSQKTARPRTLSQIQRDMERALEPMRAAQRAAAAAFAAPIQAAARAHERVLAPLREVERQQKAIFASLDAGIGQFIREIVPDGSINQFAESEMLRELREIEGHQPPPAPARNVPTKPASPGGLSEADISKLVDRIADEIIRRMATSEGTNTAKKEKSRRGRKSREIWVGGVDPAIESLAAADPGVMSLSARKLAERLGGEFAYTTVQKSPVYKAWRKRLRELRNESKAFGVSGLFEAGLASVSKRKPGRNRLKDPTVDPEMEERTRAFLKAHEDERLNGQ